jgi:Zn-dependent protease with chaperone function
LLRLKDSTISKREASWRPVFAIGAGLLFCAFTVAVAAPPLCAQSFSRRAASADAAAPTNADALTNAAASAVRSHSSPPENVTHYTLPPDKYAKARHLGRLDLLLYFIDTAYGIFALLLVLRLRVPPRFRDWAERATRFRILQAAIFTSLLVLTLGLLELPVSIYGHHLSLAYGLSIERWGPWAWDWTKGQWVNWIIASVVVWILYALIRRSPRRWWFYFWLALIPLGATMIFLEPLVVDPLFHHFEPLARTDPALVAALEHVSQRAGVRISPERMFLMRASEKSTVLNAYVTGLGGSKRIVVYDNTIARMTTPQIAFTFGHEMGHYVLGHVTQGFVFGLALAFVGLFLAHRIFGWTLVRWSSAWGIRGADDWASLPVLLLLLSVAAIFITPIANSFSRHVEHQADVYGLEITHGLTRDSAQTAAQAFQILGEVDLDDPAPSQFARFWLYSHPSIGDRIAFALRYDPWDAGTPPRYVRAPASGQGR